MADEISRALHRLRKGTAARKLESPTLDFKAPSSSPKATFINIAEAAVCFANSVGGTIVLGVSDVVAGPDALVGIEVAPEVLRRAVYERTSPGLDVTVQSLVVDGVTLLVVTVPEGLEVYGTSTGRYCWRRGTDCLPMSADDVARLREERRGDDWSARSARRGGLEEADATALARARELLSRVPATGAATLSRGSDADLLQGLGLLTRASALTHAGWLTFARRTDYEQANIIYQYRRVAGGEPDTVLHLGGPLLLTVERLLEAVQVRLVQTPVNLAGGQQVAVPDFPPAAVREALLNAAVHGDHRTGRPVQVEHSPGWLTVTSPGPLVAGVTPENILRHPHRARFPLLFTAFRHLGLVEQVGAGVDRMYREMLRFGRNPPRIVEDHDQVSVTFVADEPNTRIARFVNTLPHQDRDDLDVLLVLGLLRRRRAVSAPAVATEIQRPAADAQVLLRRLSEGERPLLEPTVGSSHRRQPNYRLRGPVLAELGSAVGYHRAPSADRDRKIVEHLTEYGSINNRTVQNLFDVDVYRASAILRDLVARGVVVRTSDQKRGHSVRYGPGPGFGTPQRN
ncbi:MAG: ATP-binding protein [Pseudonocardiaceae bacterium]